MRDENWAKGPEKEAVKFLEYREDASISPGPSERPFDLVSLLVKSTFVASWIEVVGLMRHHPDHARFQYRLEGLFFLRGSVHHQRHADSVDMVGALIQNWSHKVLFHSPSRNAPPNAGTKHLE